jgi:hypothetical protein
MKTHITHSLLAAAAVCSLANAQTTAYTTPVGYITHTINSAGGGEALTLIGPALIQPSVFSGASTVSPSGGSLATFSGGVPTNLDATYVLEITSGANEGWWSTVTSSTATTITTNDAFPGGLASGTTVSVRKHNTVQSFLGENTPGLIPSDGVEGDEIQLLNPDQSVTPIAYFPAEVTGGDPDWYNIVTSEIANDAIIYPGTGVIIKTKSASNLTCVSTGEVKTTDTQVDVYPGLTVVAQTAAAGASLNASGINTNLIPLNAAGDNIDFDEFQVFNADQTVTPHVAADPALLGTQDFTMINFVTSEESGAVTFTEGTGAFVKRDASKPASSIVLKGAVIAQ